MAYQKLQTTSGINVVPSDDINIPSPASEVLSSTATATFTGKIQDDNGDFINKGVKVGDIVYNITDLTVATVTSEPVYVDTTTPPTYRVDISANIMKYGNDYKIFRPDNQNNGCIIYVGTSINNAQPITIETAGGDKVSLRNVIQGSFLPVQVVKVFSSGTSVSDIVAFW